MEEPTASASRECLLLLEGDSSFLCNDEIGGACFRSDVLLLPLPVIDWEALRRACPIFRELAIAPCQCKCNSAQNECNQQ